MLLPPADAHHDKLATRTKVINKLCRGFVIFLRGSLGDRHDVKGTPPLVAAALRAVVARESAWLQVAEERKRHDATLADGLVAAAPMAARITARTIAAAVTMPLVFAAARALYG